MKREAVKAKGRPARLVRLCLGTQAGSAHAERRLLAEVRGDVAFLLPWLLLFFPLVKVGGVG